MNNKRISGKYYESQTGVGWDQKRNDFEVKMNELRQVKTDLVDYKQALLSPKSRSFSNPVKIEDLQMCLLLKQEENESLSKLLGLEKDKLQEMKSDLSRAKTFYMDLEKKLQVLQAQVVEKDRLLDRFYGEMTSIKQNVQNWLSPTRENSGFRRESEGVHKNILENDEIFRLRRQLADTQELYRLSLQEIEEIKRKSIGNGTFLEYSRLPREKKTEVALQNYLDEISELKKQQEDMILQHYKDKEEFEITEEEYKIKIIELQQEIDEAKSEILRANEEKVKNNEKNQEDFLKNEEKERKNKEVLKDLQGQIEFLKENNEKLQEKVNSLGNEKYNLLLGETRDSLTTAEEFANLILENHAFPGEKREKIERNLCNLLVKHKETLSVILTQDVLFAIYGKTPNFQVTPSALKNSIYKSENALNKPPEEGMRTPNTRKIIFQETSHRKNYQSLSQKSLQKLMPRADQSLSKSFSLKNQKNIEESYQSTHNLENLITDLSEPDKKVDLHENYSDSDIFIQTSDLLQFLQCAASSIEDLLTY